jgi:hypothetical protein
MVHVSFVVKMQMEILPTLTLGVQIQVRVSLKCPLTTGVNVVLTRPRPARAETAESTVVLKALMGV